jgi:acetoin utilization deacetylase AcuC-like enzyme
MNDIVFFYPSGHETHQHLGHVERPERLQAIHSALAAGGWWAENLSLSAIELSDEVLQYVHHPAYLEQLDLACRSGRSLDADTYTTPASYHLALMSAGGAAAIARAVWRREACRGFALCRPPGHHATRTRGMGFCLLNNIALAAADLLLNEGAARLAIIDLDLHHGNGTQDIFYDRDDVFYFSTHQFPFYPGTGRIEETGRDEGRGTTANFPLPAASGDSAILTTIDRLILPLLDRYQPALLLVSAGFDAHWRDPLGNLLVTASGYGEAIRTLSGWADQNCSGRIALVLEGGYDLLASASCASACTAALLGETWVDPIEKSPYPEQDGWRPMIQQGTELWNLG